MNSKLHSAQPPYFSEARATTIVSAVREYPDADGFLVHFPEQKTLVVASIVAGIVGRWVVESPVSTYDLWQRQAQLGQTGMKYVCLAMDTSTLVPLPTQLSH